MMGRSCGAVAEGFKLFIKPHQTSEFDGQFGAFLVDHQIRFFFEK